MFSVVKSLWTKTRDWEAAHETSKCHGRIGGLVRCPVSTFPTIGIVGDLCQAGELTMLIDCSSSYVEVPQRAVCWLNLNRVSSVQAMQCKLIPRLMPSIHPIGGMCSVRASNFRASLVGCQVFTFDLRVDLTPGLTTIPNAPPSRMRHRS
jgi:hypothetical protein